MELEIAAREEVFATKNELKMLFTRLISRWRLFAAN